MEIPKNQIVFSQQIIAQLTSAGANAVFINPWSDGDANYQSKLARQNKFGQQQFLEKFIKQAHNANLKVFAWFVVGKDNFPFNTHPEWQAVTIQDKPYIQEDEPGINLPFASLANQQYLNYHLVLVNEVNQLPIDGWVISEPLIGWGDKYDSDYTDFSSAALKLYQQNDISNPKQVIRQTLNSNQVPSQELYQKLIDVRADIVTNFVNKTMQQIKQDKTKRIVITVFTEPDKQGSLISFDQIKEWLGTDINKLASFNPDIIEIQSLFLDFEYAQSPAWTTDMIQQFRQQLNLDIPIAVSIQGFDSKQSLAPTDFSTAMSAALNQSAAGTSFYAYHTLKPEHWRQLTNLWQKTKP